MRSPENVLESLKSKACNQSYKYERLYRNLYNPQFYLLAYQRIQAKPGNMTAGTDGKTIDGMGMARVNALIEKMRDFSYQPNPARRTYIPKSNGKMRPLGIPSFDDKLIQAAVSGYLAIRLLRYIAKKGSFGWFSYYCWGAGLVTLALSLIA